MWGTGPGLGVTRDGAHAQYITVPVEFVATKPERLTFEEAAAIGVPFTTAWAALIGAAQLGAGETILITGAGGAGKRPGSGEEFTGSARRARRH